VSGSAPRLRAPGVGLRSNAVAAALTKGRSQRHPHRVCHAIAYSGATDHADRSQRGLVAPPDIRLRSESAALRSRRATRHRRLMDARAAPLGGASGDDAWNAGDRRSSKPRGAGQGAAAIVLATPALASAGWSVFERPRTESAESPRASTGHAGARGFPRAFIATAHDAPRAAPSRVRVRPRMPHRIEKRFSAGAALCPRPPTT
jgi:hypothetical protein